MLLEDVQFAGLLFVVAILYTVEFAAGLIPSPVTLATLQSMPFWAVTIANVVIGTVVSSVITIEISKDMEG